MPRDSKIFSRRQRSLSHEVNSDPSNPVLNFVQDMINKMKVKEAVSRWSTKT